MLKILIVDDNEETRSNGKEALEQLGISSLDIITPQTLSDAKESAIAFEDAHEPWVLVLDHQLSGISWGYPKYKSVDFVQEIGISTNYVSILPFSRDLGAMVITLSRLGYNFLSTSNVDKGNVDEIVKAYSEIEQLREGNEGYIANL